MSLWVKLPSGRFLNLDRIDSITPFELNDGEQLLSLCYSDGEDQIEDQEDVAALLMYVSRQARLTAAIKHPAVRQ